ncbi:MAG: putative DNA binding domain-containing protein [Chitinophagaceae bacterium]
MNEAALKAYLRQHFPKENEKCEWKEFKNLKHAIAGHEGNDIISYVSAIANMKGGALVIGVEDTTLDIVGIQDFSVYTAESLKLRLIKECVYLSDEGLDIEEVKSDDTNKTVWIIHIPKHQFRLPVIAHKKRWQRIGDSLVEMQQSRLDAILNEVKSSEDWTAVVVSGASFSDLDPIAIEKARKEYVKRNPKYADEIDSWDDSKFLDKAKLTIKGGITRTALILLGKEESEHFLGSFVKIRWNLKTVSGEDKDFEIFSIPFILNVDEVYKKIRNLRYRYLRDGTLFPDEVLRYDPFNIREPLNNAIAHQDYTKGARINIVEFEDDHLVFSNYASFLPKSVRDVVLSDTPEEVYRNPFLVEAMKNLDMIETQGGGIRKIFNIQSRRFFPLPDYDLSEGKVKVTIVGKVLDEDFARILVKNPDLSLSDIMLLDKVQKKQQLTDIEFKYLKKLGLIEGRRPNVFLAYKVIEPVNNEALKQEYIANRSFDDEYFKELILKYIKKSEQVKRGSLDDFIMPKLSAVLTEKQKKAKVTNLLSALRMAGKIKNTGYGTWELQDLNSI